MWEFYYFGEKYGKTLKQHLVLLSFNMFGNRFLVIILLLLFSCKSKVRIGRENDVESNYILGCWKNINGEIGYPCLSFMNDSTAIFTSKGDTLYRMKYHLKGSNLYLFDREKTFDFPITKFTDTSFCLIDSMILNTELCFKRDTCIIRNNDTVKIVSANGKPIIYSGEPPPRPPITKDDVKRKIKPRKQAQIKILKDCCTTEDSLEPKPPLIEK